MEKMKWHPFSGHGVYLAPRADIK